MNRSFTRNAGCLAVAALLVLSASAQAQPEHDPGVHAHDHAQQGAAELTLDHGQPWGTDAPLREGMERVRTAVATAEQAAAQGGMTASQAQSLAVAVEDGIAFMVRNCQLESQADANLHVLLGRLSAAAAAVKTDPGAANGLAQMLEVLDLYPRHFNHPGWQPVERAAVS